MLDAAHRSAVPSRTSVRAVSLPLRCCSASLCFFSFSSSARRRASARIASTSRAAAARKRHQAPGKRTPRTRLQRVALRKREVALALPLRLDQRNLGEAFLVLCAPAARSAAATMSQGASASFAARSMARCVDCAAQRRSRLSARRCVAGTHRRPDRGSVLEGQASPFAPRSAPDHRPARAEPEPLPTRRPSRWEAMAIDRKRVSWARRPAGRGGAGHSASRPPSAFIGRNSAAARGTASGSGRVVRPATCGARGAALRPPCVSDPRLFSPHRAAGSARVRAWRYEPR